MSAEKIEDPEDLFPEPDYRFDVLTIDGESVECCPFCFTPREQGEIPEGCCAGQSYQILRSRVVKIADLMNDPKTSEKALDLFFLLADCCR